MQEKTGNVEPGITRTENGNPCVEIRADGEPIAIRESALNKSAGNLNQLTQAMVDKTFNPQIQ